MFPPHRPPSRLPFASTPRRPRYLGSISSFFFFYERAILISDSAVTAHYYSSRYRFEFEYHVAGIYRDTRRGRSVPRESASPFLRWCNVRAIYGAVHRAAAKEMLAACEMQPRTHNGERCRRIKDRERKEREGGGGGSGREETRRSFHLGLEISLKFMNRARLAPLSRRGGL